MRFYTGQHRFHCGVDLHAHTMYVCVLDAAGQIVLERNLPTTPEAFLAAVAPFRDGLVVACECLFVWYWLADLCAKEQISFVLGHALYMKAIHGGKAKNDRIDAHKIAVLLRGGMLPQAYVYPPGMRETRDLLRRRLHLVRKRGQLLAHLQNLTHAYNRGAFEKRIAYPSNREGVVAHFAGEPMVQANAGLDLALLAKYDELLVELELQLVRQAKREAPTGFHLLRSIPGIGKVLAMTIVYELHDVARFERVQQFASYARLVKCAKESAGKRKGTSGAKMGNVHLKWAFSEAAVLFVRHSAKAKALLARMTKRHGKGKALSILAHKIGRAAYYVLLREEALRREEVLRVRRRVMRARAASPMPNVNHEGPSSTEIDAKLCATERERPIGSPTSGSPLALIGRRSRSISNISHLDGAAPPPSLRTTELRARRHEEDGMRERMSF